MSKLIPFGKRIIVKREEVKDVTEGGIYLPATAIEKEKPRKGTVLATSEGSGIAVGDVVIFGKFAGLELDEEEVLILKLDDIHAIVKSNS